MFFQATLFSTGRWKKDDLTFEIKNMQTSCLNMILHEEIEIEENYWSAIENSNTLKSLNYCIINLVYILKFTPKIHNR